MGKRQGGVILKNKHFVKLLSIIKNNNFSVMYLSKNGEEPFGSTKVKLKENNKELLFENKDESREFYVSFENIISILKDGYRRYKILYSDGTYIHMMPRNNPLRTYK